MPRRRLRYRDLLALDLAGILPVGAPIGVAPLIKYAGASAIWPVLLGYAMVLLSAIPVLEYSRLAAFAGGYYGLAELGLGPTAGKFTALANYLYYVAWQIQNALQAGWIVYSITGSPAAWAGVVAGVLILSYIGAVSPPRAYAADVLLPILASTISVTLAMDLYVVLKSPYNSPAYLYPGDWSAVAVAASVQGFWMFVGYGTPLFYSEEAENPRRDIWRSVAAATTISAVVYALSAYAVVAAVPPAEVEALSSSPMPYLTAWSRYYPEALLLSYPLLMAPAALAYGGPTGSHARLLWAMARDGFIESRWIEAVDKNGVPRNAATLNLLISAASAYAVAGAIFITSGVDATAAEKAWLVASTGATVLWYAHHVLPEVALYPLLRRTKAGVGKMRAVLTGVVAPAAGAAIFVYTSYELAVHKPLYSSAVYVAAAISAAALAYTFYRRSKGKLGRSVVAYLAAVSNPPDMGQKTH